MDTRDMPMARGARARVIKKPFGRSCSRETQAHGMGLRTQSRFWIASCMLRWTSQHAENMSAVPVPAPRRGAGVDHKEKPFSSIFHVDNCDAAKGWHGRPNEARTHLRTTQSLMEKRNASASHLGQGAAVQEPSGQTRWPAWKAVDQRILH